MSLRKNKREIERLIKAFEAEAAKFHNITFSTYVIRSDRPLDNRKFRTPNHAIMLWQHYGKLATEEDTERLVRNLKESDMQWGMRGAEISFFGLIEGDSYELFVRMAKRAGSLFGEKEARKIKSRVLDEIQKKNATGNRKSSALRMTIHWQSGLTSCFITFLR